MQSLSFHVYQCQDDFAKSAYKRHDCAILTYEQAQAIFYWQVEPSPVARDRYMPGPAL